MSGSGITCSCREYDKSLRLLTYLVGGAILIFVCSTRISVIRIVNFVSRRKVFLMITLTIYRAVIITMSSSLKIVLLQDKYAVTRHKPVGHYGNGFKSGSMRLGRDALVLSRHGHGKGKILFIATNVLSS